MGGASPWLEAGDPAIQHTLPESWDPKVYESTREANSYSFAFLENVEWSAET